MWTLSNELQRQLDLPWPLSIVGLSHRGQCIPEVSVGRVEVGVVERVEHLSRELQAELLRDIEPLLYSEVLVNVAGSSQIGEESLCVAKRVCRRLRKGGRIEETILCSTGIGLVVPAPQVPVPFIAAPVRLAC